MSVILYRRYLVTSILSDQEIENSTYDGGKARVKIKEPHGLLELKDCQCFDSQRLSDGHFG